jgi:hypothetical protein
MPLSWTIFFSAALALAFPLPAFYSRKRRFRTLHALDIERRNGSRWLMLGHVLRFAGHWIELARGLLASLGMLATIDRLEAVSPFYASHSAWARSVLPLALAILCVGLIALLFRYPGKSLAPIPFLTATLLVLVPLAVSLPALLLAITAAAALRSLAAFFLILTPALVLLGLLLDRQVWPSVAGAVLALTPGAIAFLRHHEFVIPVRRPAAGA